MERETMTADEAITEAKRVIRRLFKQCGEFGETIERSNGTAQMQGIIAEALIDAADAGYMKGRHEIHQPNISVGGTTNLP
jgi:hypothetical protein